MRGNAPDQGQMISWDVPGILQINTVAAAEPGDEEAGC